MPGEKRHQVLFRKSARKEFLDLPIQIQDRVIEALSFLSESPYTSLLPIKKLKGPEKLYRIRIGDYRLVYAVESSQLIVIVVKIGHRREVYR